MKQTIKTLLIIIVVGILGFLSYRVVQTINYKKEVAEHLETMPDFAFTNIATDQPFTNTELAPSTPTIFIYFNSTCDFCQHEAKGIQEQIDLFSDVQIVFVSEQEKEEIEAFSRNYQLNNLPNVFFVQDENDLFSKQFDATSIPYLIIYNKNNQLLTANKGQLKPEAIHQLIYE